MTDRLKNRRALITGAAGGIGSATADLFCAEGADLVLVDFNAEATANIAAKIGAAYPDRRVSGVVADIAEEDQCASAIAAATTALGGLDILINGAAARTYGSLADASSDSWRDILSVNLIGTQNMTRAALPELRRASTPSIVNISSVFAAAGRRGMGQYDATKAALLSVTRTLAAEEAEFGLRVNAVCPGSVWTPYTASRAEARSMTPAQLRENGAVPSILNRWGEVEEIAYPILWLASQEASFITGTCLMVDGGLSATQAN